MFVLNKDREQVFLINDGAKCQALDGSSGKQGDIYSHRLRLHRCGGKAVLDTAPPYFLFSVGRSINLCTD